MPERDPDQIRQPERENLVYETPWLDFYYDDIVQPNGEPGKYAWIKSHSGNGAVMTIPVTPSGKYLLIKVFRHPSKRYLWEFPAGVMEDGELPLETGRRELVEEVGVEPLHIDLLGSQIPVAGHYGHVFHSLVAEIPEISLDDITLQSEEGIVDAKLLSRQELIAMIDSEEIGEGVMLMSLARYWAHQELKSGGSGR